MVNRSSVSADTAVVILELGRAIGERHVELANVGVSYRGRGTVWRVPGPIGAQNNISVLMPPPINPDGRRIQRCSYPNRSASITLS
jgi:hypothetical protein